MMIHFKIFYEECLKMGECSSIKHNFHNTPNMYLNLSANISNEQEFGLNKIKSNQIKLKIIFQLRLEKEK